MTDRHEVDKKFVELLQQWRENALPKIVEHWDQLSENVKYNMTIVNDLYCGKHLILNFQDYAGAALNDWEKVEVDVGQIGRDKFVRWGRKESATRLAVRTVYGPDLMTIWNKLVIQMFGRMYGVGKDHADLHCDNCSGQNKNRYMYFGTSAGVS